MARAYTEYERLIAEASKAWRRYERIRSDEFAEREEARRVVIADGHYTGRPPVSISEKREKARQQWRMKLSDLRSYEQDKGIQQIPETDIKAFVEQRHGRKGRRPGGRAVALQKYIRRMERQICETEDAPEERFSNSSGRGRPKMSRKQKVKHFHNLIAKARKELYQIYEEMDEEDRLWHLIHDLKSHRRQLRLALKTPKNPQIKAIWRQFESIEEVREQLEKTCTEIAKLEAEMALIQAGGSSNEFGGSETENMERYRRSLEIMVREQKKIKALEREAEELGINISKLRP